VRTKYVQAAALFIAGRRLFDWNFAHVIGWQRVILPRLEEKWDFALFISPYKSSNKGWGWFTGKFELFYSMNIKSVSDPINEDLKYKPTYAVVY
jgi:hypothetical protein